MNTAKKVADKSPTITEERLQEILMKMGVAWDRNGNVKKISQKEASQDNSLTLSEHRIQTLESKNTNIWRAFTGMAVAIIAAIFYFGSQANQVSTNKDDITVVQNKRETDRDWILANFQTKEAFNAFKEATDTEILDRKNYSVKNLDRIEEVNTELHQHIATGHHTH